VQSAAGDGFMAVFPSDAAAVRAARHLQEDLPRFNAQQNHLPAPFRIRCGVSAGDVAIEPGTPLGHLHSAVVDRAAALQKQAEPGDILVDGDISSAALQELGLSPTPAQPADATRAYSWRRGATGNLPI
jgi:class 3 adenylate cyclase